MPGFGVWDDLERVDFGLGDCGVFGWLLDVGLWYLGVSGVYSGWVDLWWMAVGVVWFSLLCCDSCGVVWFVLCGALWVVCVS